MKNGEVYLLDYWYMEGDSLFLKGYGEKLDINRKVIRTNEYNRDHISRNTPYSIPVDEIFILETNQVDKTLMGGVALVTGVTGVVTLMCLISPKTCFGSCPTFYALDLQQKTGQMIKLYVNIITPAAGSSNCQCDIEKKITLTISRSV
ncbi:hypothetical protein ACFFUR_13215, partial [Echinicola jeungdonensis]